MPTSSASYSDLEAFAAELGRWSDAVLAWERRLAGDRTVGPAVLIRSYRFLLEGHRRTLVERALAFRRADAHTELLRRSSVARSALAVPSTGAGSRRARVRNGLARRIERVYLRADGRGDGQVVEVLGDLPAAEHIVILIPGMTNELSNYDTQLRPKALAFLAEMRRQAPQSGVAVVAWLGYDTPDLNPRGIADARGSALAKKGARSLRDDLGEIRRLNGNAHITAVGHSYGSVVIGQAMRDGLDRAGVGDVVVVGSPGMDADSRLRLRSPDIRLWASKATLTLPVPVPLPVRFPLPVIREMIADPVAMAPAHGEDPSAHGFGASRFSSKGTRTHGAYFAPGSVSIANMAKIALGDGASVTK